MSTKDNKTQTLPRHIAIIPDGNRRWAKERGLPTLQGHRKGAENFNRLIDAANELGIKCFTTWVFSTENWNRDEKEISYLFDIAREFTEKYTKKCLKDKIRFVHLGRKDRLPKDIVDTINNMEEKTKEFDSFTFAGGMDYGGHDELVRTINKLIDQKLEINKENIENNLDTNDLPPIDLIIRTSGEKRLSGFMSWQCAYAEFYFADVHFPDFDKEELKKAIDSYCNRERRFGGNSTSY